MRLSDYVPQVPEWESQRRKLDGLIGFYEFITKADEGNTYRSPTFGVDTLVSHWIKQQIHYRSQMIQDLFTIANTVSEIRGPITHIRNEVFRKGFDWYPKFTKKCEKCGKKYVELVKECENCGEEGKLINPDEKQKERLELFFSDCNIFDQSLQEVLMQCEFDVNIADELNLYIAKEFYADGDVVRSKPIEIRRLHPAFIELDLDSKGLPKNKHWFCLIHRDEMQEIKGDFVSDENQEMKCSKCKRDLVPAMYVFNHRGKFKYLLDSEICRASKFEISELGGWSPILTIFEKALTLIGMDRTAFRYFFERKMPASILAITTDDVEGLRREKENLKQQMRLDPDATPILGISARTGSRGRAEIIRLFHTFSEMDYMPIKNDIRERIAALWGVTPIWQSSVDSVGGLASQTAQLVVTSRVVEADQRIFNEKVFPYICESFGITDWGLKLKQPEEKAEQTRINFAAQRIMAANQLHAMGFKVKLRPGVKSIDEIDFEISGEASEMGGMGGMGGMFGGGAPGGAEGGAEGGQRLGFSQDIPNTWVGELNKSGHYIDSCENFEVLENGSVNMAFMSNGELYLAEFNPLGKLLDVSKNKYPINRFPAVPGGKKGIARDVKQETQLFKDNEED